MGCRQGGPCAAAPRAAAHEASAEAECSEQPSLGDELESHRDCSSALGPDKHCRGLDHSGRDRAESNRPHLLQGPGAIGLRGEPAGTWVARHCCAAGGEEPQLMTLNPSGELAGRALTGPNLSNGTRHPGNPLGCRLVGRRYVDGGVRRTDEVQVAWRGRHGGNTRSNLPGEWKRQLPRCR